MRATVVAFAILFAPSPAPAQEVALAFGVDARGGGKLLGLSVSDRVLHPALRVEAAAGTFNGNNFFNSDPEAFASIGLGVEAGDLAYARAVAGPAWITGGVGQVGGHFAARLAVGLGVRSEWGRVGLHYQHLSNAGLARPNRGLDHVGIEAAIAW